MALTLLAVQPELEDNLHCELGILSAVQRIKVTLLSILSEILAIPMMTKHKNIEPHPRHQ